MKDKSTAAILAFFLGGLGIHRFYTNQIGLGIFYLLFCWTFIPIFVSIIDCIVWICTSDAEFNKQYNQVAMQQQNFMHQQMEHSKNISASLANSNKMNIGSEIEKLHELKEKGIITVEEFESQKAVFFTPNQASSQVIPAAVVKQVEDQEEPFYETATFWILTTAVILIIIAICI